jgi:hypothetical protein
MPPVKRKRDRDEFFWSPIVHYARRKHVFERRDVATDLRRGEAFARMPAGLLILGRQMLRPYAQVLEKGGVN